VTGGLLIVLLVAAFFSGSCVGMLLILLVRE
jgi:hypothetical protein